MKYLHTMLRVTDPDETIRFFNLLGLSETRRMVNEQGRFTLIFLAADEDRAGPRQRATPEVKLTHNWPPVDGSEPERYAGGRNLGHLAYRGRHLRDLRASHERGRDNQSPSTRRLYGFRSFSRRHFH